MCRVRLLDVPALHTKAARERVKASVFWLFGISNLRVQMFGTVSLGASYVLFPLLGGPIFFGCEFADSPAQRQTSRADCVILSRPTT